LFYKVSVYNRLISIQRRFFWGWGKENRTISWVGWENVCKPLEEGGWGLKTLESSTELFWPNGNGGW